MENIKQLSVLKTCGGTLQVTIIPVEDSSFIINQIEAAVNNENITLMDVQDIFINRNNRNCLITRLENFNKVFSLRENLNAA
jgi:hypothetical protein